MRNSLGALRPIFVLLTAAVVTASPAAFAAGEKAPTKKKTICEDILDGSPVDMAVVYFGRAFSRPLDFDNKPAREEPEQVDAEVVALLAEEMGLRIEDVAPGYLLGVQSLAGFAGQESEITNAQRYRAAISELAMARWMSHAQAATVEGRLRLLLNP